jgi:hypothetical protein
MIKKAQPTPAPKPLKAYVPAPHPQQSRIDDIRVIPSLVTTNPANAPKGK